MTDVNMIASRYIDLWNERSPDRRREILSQHWAADASYIDPLMSGDGHDGVDALIMRLQLPREPLSPQTKEAGRP